jgi:hypothetical protein
MSKHDYFIFFFTVAREVVLAQNQILDSDNYKTKKLRILSETIPKELTGIKDRCVRGIIAPKEYSDAIKYLLKTHPEKEGGFEYTIFEVNQDDKSKSETLKKHVEIWDKCDWYL